MAFPIAVGFLANCFADWFRGLAMRDTMGRFADGHTFGAIFSLAGFVRAHDLAVGFLTFDITHCVFGLLA